MVKPLVPYVSITCFKCAVSNVLVDIVAACP